MKKSLNKKIICLAAVAALLVAGLKVESSLAYFTTYSTAEGGAKISLGSSKTELIEEVSDWTKRVQVENTGERPCYVRIQAFSGKELSYSDENGKWTKGSDGCYYYSEILEAGARSEVLKIEIKGISEDTADSFNVIVLQESTPVLYNDEGEPYADWDLTVSSEMTVSSEQNDQVVKGDEQ
jgi:hypothetical protein